MDPDPFEEARRRILAGMPPTPNSPGADPYGDFLSYLSANYPDYTTTDYQRSLMLNPHWHAEPYRVGPPDTRPSYS